MLRFKEKVKTCVKIKNNNEIIILYLLIKFDHYFTF